MKLQKIRFLKMRAARQESEAAWSVAGCAVAAMHWGVLPEHIRLNDDGTNQISLPDDCPRHVADDVAIPALSSISPRRLACPQIPAIKQALYFERLQARVTRSMRRARGPFGYRRRMCSRTAEIITRLFSGVYPPVVAEIAALVEDRRLLTRAELKAVALRNAAVFPALRLEQ